MELSMVIYVLVYILFVIGLASIHHYYGIPHMLLYLYELGNHTHQPHYETILFSICTLVSTIICWYWMRISYNAKRYGMDYLENVLS